MPKIMTKNTPFVILVALACVTACPFAQSGRENPHARDIRRLRRQQFQPQDFNGTAPERFNGTIPEAIVQARAEIISILRNKPSLGPAFVRLGFHDCVGGCNGCIDLSNPDNNGLEIPMLSLEDTCILFRDQLTRADCWALAALTAADMMQQSPVGVNYDFVYFGRKTCTNATSFGDGGDAVHMPSPHFVTKEMLSFFEDEFNFTANETVAIMGAHTLGQLRNENSGFRGSWTVFPEILDIEFYMLLIDFFDTTLPTDQYVQISDLNANGQYSWNAGLVMLNADMALVSNFDGYINTISGLVDCAIRANPNDNHTVCSKASTFDTVAEYSLNNALWLKDFHSVFDKMMVNGHNTSHCDGVSLCKVIPTTSSGIGG